MLHRKFIYFVIAILFASSCQKSSDDSVSFYEEMRAADKVVFASMSITKTARIEDSEWYKVGKRIAVYSYDTYLQAYIDMSLLTPDDLVFDDKAKTVRITLPPIMVELDGRDMEMKKVYQNVGIFRSEIDAKERAAIKELANQSLKRELEGDGSFKRQLTATARRKARIYFESLSKSQGYSAYIEFENDPRDYMSPEITAP